MSMSTTDSVHVIRIEHGKANAIDAAFLDRITTELDRAMDEERKAVVITGFGSFFSAGLNLETLPDTRKGMSAFVDQFEGAFMKLLRFPLPVVAAVNGHAIAGGCILASASDFRVGAAGSHRLGVSEVTLGLIFPAVAFEIMREVIVSPALADVMLDGRLLSPEEAAAAGILHEIVPKEELLDRAVARAKAFGEKSPPAFRHTKLALRAPMFERIERTAEEAKQGFLDTWFSPEVTEKRKAMLAK